VGEKLQLQLQLQLPPVYSSLNSRYLLAHAIDLGPRAGAEYSLIPRYMYNILHHRALNLM